jgi:hypothetical protein
LPELVIVPAFVMLSIAVRSSVIGPLEGDDDEPPPELDDNVRELDELNELVDLILNPGPIVCGLNPRLCKRLEEDSVAINPPTLVVMSCAVMVTSLESGLSDSTYNVPASVKPPLRFKVELLPVKSITVTPVGISKLAICLLTEGVRTTVPPSALPLEASFML